MPRVQDYLFTGRNKSDARVPISSPTTAGSLTATKKQQWQSQAAVDPFSTTSKAAAQATALAAAGAPPVERRVRDWSQ